MKNFFKSLVSKVELLLHGNQGLQVWRKNHLTGFDDWHFNTKNLFCNGLTWISQAFILLELSV